SRWTVFLIGTLLALSVSVGMAFTLEYANPSFRTPSEVLSELNIPVLAAVPKEFVSFPGNGKSHHNGKGNGNGHGNGNGNGHGNGNGVRHSLVVSRDVSVE
ncbi:MAG TPA: hypothetical protein VFE08_05240, partial [Candidatus Sulfotelmatobacter sp.]|nr:hypothetical protein [Candidatus Sulfotelmatobacter sp.]